MEKKLNLDKAKEILQLLQEDTLTPKQAKELVTLLVKLTEKQKQDLISKNEDFLSKVSQETFTQIQNALIEIKEKAHDNQLEVRQLTNKQKSLYESKMAQLEALIEEFRAFEIPELDEERLTKDILSKIPEQEEYELVGENVVNSINSLEVTPDKQIDAKHIKNLPQVKQFIGGSSGIKEIFAGTNITVDNTNPQYPVVSSSGGGGGAVDSVNGQTGVVVLDTGDISDVLNSRYVTDSQLTVIGNTSGTNTGDNAVNSLYSGLATSKQDALSGTGFVKISGTTISYDNSTYLTSLSGAVLTDQTVGQTIGTTGSRLTKLWATDITVTNAITGSITGNAGTVTNATLTTPITVNTGSVTLTGNVANTSVLTIGAGAVSISGSNTGDQTTVSGNAGTATTLQNTRTIWGQNFNGGANVTGTLALGTADLTLTGSIGATGARATKVWTTDIESTNMPTIGGVSLSSTFQPLDTQLTSLAGLTYAGNGGKFVRLNAGATDFEFATVSGSGDVVGPASSTDNAIARFDLATGKLIQNSGLILGDNNGLTGSIASGDGLVYSGSTTGSLVKLTPSGATGLNAGTSGAFLMDFTDIADGLAFQLYTNSDGATASYPQILLQADNAAYNNPLLQITHKGTGGNAVHIRLDGPSPQIEWRETGGSGSAGNGQFETQVQGDIFFINGRNSADSAFENAVWFLRPELGGSVGIGVNPYDIEKLTIGETTGNPARIAMRGTSDPTANTNYGKLWASSASFLPNWMDSAGTKFRIPPLMYAIVEAGGFNLQTASGVQSAFPTTKDVWTLAASTTYYVEGFYYITKATTALTTAIAFALGGGASITSMKLEVISTHLALNTTGTANNSTIVDRVASTVVTASSAANAMISFKGHIRMNAGGTVTPQIAWSTTATATPNMTAGSYIKFIPIGTNTENTVGSVA